jgi:hypothetical protein
VNPILLTSFGIGTALTLLLILRFGFVAATASDSPRKAKARLIASLAFSFWFCVTPVILFIYNQSLPIFEFTGKINSVHVQDSSSKHYSADLRIGIPSGGAITVYASDRSPFFRSGEQVKVRYRGDTGELVKAFFYARDGSQEGIFNSTSTLAQLFTLLVGSFCVWASLKKYRRDPIGSKN